MADETGKKSAQVNSEVGDDAPDPPIRIGVTGHRTLPDDPALAARVADVLTRIRAPASTSGGLLPCIVLSPLAEGADRLVATLALAAGHATLHAILPLPMESYMADFTTATSRDAFRALLDRASDIIVLPPAKTRTAAYWSAGEYVVDHCDALIALWDGLPVRGEGGTGAVVAHARQQRVPLFWITPAVPYDVVEEAGRGLARRRPVSETA